MSTQTIDVRAVVPAPPAAVWADLVDGASWPSWSPLGRYERERASTASPDLDPLGEIRTFHTSRWSGRDPVAQQISSAERPRAPHRASGSPRLAARLRQLVGETHAREEVVEVVPEQRLAYVLLGGMPLDGYRSTIDLAPVADGTELRWRSSFTARRSWMGPLYRRMLGVFIQRCADGLAARWATATPDRTAEATA